MKTYDFHYSVHEVDGKEFELIECSTWPRLNVQVIHTTPERFEEDLKIVKSRSLCGYSLLDKTFILKHAGGEGNGELKQSNLDEIFDGMKEIMNAAVKWWMVNSHPLKTIFQHKACTNKLYADSFYKVQKNSHSSFEVICCRS